MEADLRLILEHYDIGPMRRSTNGWTMIPCPFLEHEDSNPSAEFNENIGDWGKIKCFSCGRTGNAIDIIMEREKVDDFPTARATAARIAGTDDDDLPEPVADQRPRWARGKVVQGKGHQRTARPYRPSWRRGRPTAGA